MNVWVITFWSSVAVIVYTYVLYPVILILFPRVRRDRPAPWSAAELPSATVVVPVFNEHGVIEAKIANLEAAEYRRRLALRADRIGRIDGRHQ